MAIYPSDKDFKNLARNYPLIPVWEEMRADLETPVSLYLKMAEEGCSYLLESVEGGEHLARYSFIGTDPLLICRGKGDQMEIVTLREKRSRQGKLIPLMREVIGGLGIAPLPDQPRFCGGAVGYFGYDLVRQQERLPELTIDDLGVPDCYFMVSRRLIIYDQISHLVRLVLLVPSQPDPESAYHAGQAELALLCAKIRENGRRFHHPTGAGLRMPPAPQLTSGAAVPIYSLPGYPGVYSNTTKEQFMERVRRAQEYIRAGDIFQVVLSQRLQRDSVAHPFEYYRSLRSLNPSPYLFYLDFGELQLVGSSPEMLIRVENGEVETRPIAGTRPRGGNAAADRRLERELLADPKERAEHLMLVDLGRNDLGRISAYGSVRVEKLMELERYSHVIHLVSVIRGRLAADYHAYDSYDALSACFPAGTLSGAPKIRAMEIIEELETTRRGCYGGVIGYLAGNGNLDSCIAIRTMLIRGGTVYLQAGAGIVADSQPAGEYQETLNKAAALLDVLNPAGNSREGKVVF